MIKEFGDGFNKEYHEDDVTIDGVGKKYLDLRVCHARGHLKTKRIMSLGEMLRREKGTKRRSCKTDKQECEPNSDIMVKKINCS